MDSNDMLTVDLTESHSSSQLLTPKMPPVKRSPSKSFKQMRFGNQKNQGVFVTELSKNKADNSVICLDSDSDDSDGDSGSRNFEAPVDLPNNSNSLSNAEASSSLFEDRMKTFEPPAPTLDDTQSSVDLFYIDKSTSFKQADVPSYKSLDLSLSPLKIQENQKSNLPVLKVADCETFSSVDFSINENIRSNSDDSVIFMGEIPGTSRQNAANFIPLPSKSWSELLKTSNMPNVVPKIPIAQKSTLQTKKCRRRAKKRKLLTKPSKVLRTTPKKRERSYQIDFKVPGISASTPKIAVSLETAKTSSTSLPAIPKIQVKRMVIIDGSNVAFSHSEANVNKLAHSFSVKGIEICLKYFESRGHEVKVIIPQFRTKARYSSDPATLENLKKAGKLTITPCKSMGPVHAASYDDRFILDGALAFDAAVISNDNFQDLRMEREEYRKIIDSRVIGYTFMGDAFFPPIDPYGRNGPSLDQILCKDSSP